MVPTTTQTTPTTTSPTAAADQPDQSAPSQEVKPQVGAELSEPEQQPDQVSFSSSTSVSQSTDEGRSTTTPIGDSNPTTPKLSARSISGRISTGAPVELSSAGGGGGSQQFGSKKESSIYSTSANQGSVSYTPMDTHQLTARAFQSTAGSPPDGGADLGAKRSTIEKRFGARLQALQPPAKTSATLASHRQQPQQQPAST